MSKWTKESIQELLRTNDQAVIRAILVIYNNQTNAEQSMEATTDANGIGYTGVDGKIGASMAKFYSRNGYLSPKQIAVWRKRDKRGVMKIGKYWKQLLAEIEKKVPNG